MKRFAITLVALSSAIGASAHGQAADGLVITRAESRPARVAPGENFTGTVRVHLLFDTTAATRAYAASVSFDAGARTAWHTHPRGQVLLVTEGVGRVQRWGAPAEEIRPGDVVRIPPGVKHWHGAAPTTAMTHIAIVELQDGRSATWAEKVSDTQYGAAVSAPAAVRAPASTATTEAQPSAAQRLMGDVAPKLAQLTDSVLFGDVWARPGLSQRDRSLVTVSALIAMNRPDQLRSHMARASANGVTREEMIEAITHLAFYAGWPSALTAVGVAREVLPPR
ncbi:MAG TPA: carboxymuconolactone decarboxylase family protein [Gemmatimonadaceae bacterium]|nr:carboxymuconolactone decarboxylase family protein [Gemmatimonadaceae bacterium]